MSRIDAVNKLIIEAGKLTFQMLKIHTWKDLETLFSQVPAPGMCWCMYWRKTRAEWWGKSKQNKHCLKEIVESGKVPGILAYMEGNVIGWCSIAPRSEFPGLDRSPTLKRIDDADVWSITCFVIAKEYKRQGVATALKREAMRYAASRSAKIIEA